MAVADAVASVSKPGSDASRVAHAGFQSSRGASIGLTRHDHRHSAPVFVSTRPAATVSRARMRLVSVSWAVAAALAAALVAFALASWQGADSLDPAARAAGCGFFYGLLAFHLQRVDPDDSHLQAGLVGAVCALRSLGGASLSTTLDSALGTPLHPVALAPRLLSAMMAMIGTWLPLWSPLIASALLLLGLQRWLPSRA